MSILSNLTAQRAVDKPQCDSTECVTVEIQLGLDHCSVTFGPCSAFTDWLVFGRIHEFDRPKSGVIRSLLVYGVH